MRIRSVALCAALLGCCAAVPLSDWHDGIAVRPAPTLSQDMLGMCHVTRLRLRLLRGGALTPPRAAQTNYGGAQDGMSPYTPSFGTLEVLPPPGMLAPGLGMDGALFGLPQPCRRTFQAAKVAWMRQGLTSGVRQGACGYGKLDKSQYPYWSVAALSLTNSFSVAGPAHACGMCFEIKCVDVGGAYGVRPSSFFFQAPRWLYVPSSIALGTSWNMDVYTWRAECACWNICRAIGPSGAALRAGPLQQGPQPAQRDRDDHGRLPRVRDGPH